MKVKNISIFKRHRGKGISVLQCACLSFPYFTHLIAIHHSIIQGLKLFLWEFCIPLLNTIHHLFHTFTAGWRPESNRASFLMMLPTPGMTAWSRRTSQSILLLWLLTASSEWEKLNLEEHTSRLSMALTLCSQSSVNLQIHSCSNGKRQKIYSDSYWKCATGSTGALKVTVFKIVSFIYSVRFVCYGME